MYIPAAFREDDPERLAAFIRAHGFGTVVSTEGGHLVASHLPLLLDTARGPQGTLLGHMARENAQWRSFHTGSEVLVIFPGPHAYVSPSWYTVQPAVPTWNYAAVHAYGIPQLIEEEADLRKLLDSLVATHEAGFGRPWRLEDQPEAYITGMMAAIVGFAIPIGRLEGKLKLNQNRPEIDREGVIAGLRSRGTPLELDVAELMARSPVSSSPREGEEAG